MATVVELIVLVGLIITAGVAWKLNKRYDLKQSDMNPIVKRKYQ